MSFRDTLIRLAVTALFFLRRKECARTDLRVIAFTGTAGKTLARSAVREALERTGYAVISPPYGYTNELGIVLALLGIEDPLRLRSFEGLRKMCTSRAPQDAFICVEVAADWRADGRWFSKRIRPYLLCLTDLDPVAWARPIAAVLDEKRGLVRCLAKKGRVVLSTTNPSYEALHAIARNEETSAITFTADERSVTLSDGHLNRTYVPAQMHDARAYREALGFAVACVSGVCGGNVPDEILNAGYGTPPDRLRTLRVGDRILIADTYKAVPYCVEQVLAYAFSIPAPHRTLVLSAVRPSPYNRLETYARFTEIIRGFNLVYFVGENADFAAMQAVEPRARRIYPREYAKLARTLLADSSPQGQIVIKGAGRYELDALVEALASASLSSRETSFPRVDISSSRARL